MNSQAAAVLGYQYEINHHLKILMGLDFLLFFLFFHGCHVRKGGRPLQKHNLSPLTPLNTIWDKSGVNVSVMQ